jgi:twitching motility protein PilT
VKLVDSLLDAMSRLEGDALIMHVGEKPYVVTTSASMYAYRGPVAWGHVELSSRVLTTDAVVGMLEQLVPADQRQALDEYGAIEHALPPSATSADRFTVVAARGGDDVWLEVRRTPAAIGAIGTPEPARVEEPQPSTPGRAVAIPELVAIDPATIEPLPTPVVPAPVAAVDQAEPAPVGAEPEPAAVAYEPAPQPVAVEPEQAPLSSSELPVAVEQAAQVVAEEQEAARVVTEKRQVLAAAEPVVERTPEPTPEPVAAASEAVAAAQESAPFEIVEEEPQIVPTQAEVDELLTASAAALSSAGPVAAEDSPAPPEAVASVEPEAEPVAELPRPKPVDEPRQAVVLPLARSPIASEPIVEVRTTAGTPLERVLKIAAARGAATVYIVARSQPVIRVDGEISVLDGEPALTAAEVERLVMDLAPARARDVAPAGEWMADVPDVGRVRCVTFRDHRGPGVIFRMIPPKAISADQLGIPPEVQALCAQPDGLVLVTGARASGKSTLLSAFVDLINRTRSDHVITIESQIGFVHESRRSFVSQREVRGAAETAAGAVRSAFREDPDVLVIEDLRTPEIVSAAFEAAESGRLVFGSVSAPSTIAALDRLIEMFPLDRRAQAQTSLAGALRGVVAQTLLRKVRGGRIAAREILLNTPAVASLILEGKTFQLPVALDSGRRHGMMPLADALAALVRDGTVHAAEAYRKATDRDALLAALRRDGVDTSFAERLA